MAFSSGFFNSKGLDRTYTAENFTDYLSSLICNGILDTYGEQFELTAPAKGLTHKFHSILMCRNFAVNAVSIMKF